MVRCLPLFDVQEGQEDLVSDVKGEETTAVGSLGHNNHTIFLWREKVAPFIGDVVVNLVRYCVFTTTNRSIFRRCCLEDEIRRSLRI